MKNIYESFMLPKNKLLEVIEIYEFILIIIDLVSLYRSISYFLSAISCLQNKILKNGKKGVY